MLRLSPHRRLCFALVTLVALSSATGCLIPMYSADPSRRSGQLLNTSEDLRQALDEWERIWFLDQPSHMVVDRVHGGITPGQGNLIPGQ